MPSSTSSSSQRVPRDPYALSVILGALLFAAAFANIEFQWRQRGYQPSVDDDLDLWACQRARVYEAGERTVVLLGTSRILLDFSTDTFRRRFPRYEVVQLAVCGLNPVAAFRDLADDQDFCGIVLYDAGQTWLRLDMPGGEEWEQDKYVKYYHREFTLNKRIDRTIGAWIEAHFATVNSALAAKTLIERRWRGEGLPQPYFLTTHFDRSTSADLSHIDFSIEGPNLTNAIWRTYKGYHPQEYDDWVKGLDQIDLMVEKIQGRSGKVVFIRFPTTDVSTSVNEQYYPRSEYWDAFAVKTKGLAIHCADFPSLSQFECPDTSHLDQRDAPAFTNALLDELVRLNVFPKEEDASGGQIH